MTHDMLQCFTYFIYIYTYETKAKPLQTNLACILIVPSCSKVMHSIRLWVPQCAIIHLGTCTGHFFTIGCIYHMVSMVRIKQAIFTCRMSQYAYLVVVFTVTAVVQSCLLLLYYPLHTDICQHSWSSDVHDAIVGR